MVGAGATVALREAATLFRQAMPRYVHLLVATDEHVAATYRRYGEYAGLIEVLADAYGSNFGQYLSVPQEAVPSRSVLYHGPIDDALDYELLHQLVHLLPDWKFVFAAPPMINCRPGGDWLRMAMCHIRQRRALRILVPSVRMLWLASCLSTWTLVGRRVGGLHRPYMKRPGCQSWIGPRVSASCRRRRGWRRCIVRWRKGGRRPVPITSPAPRCWMRQAMARRLAQWWRTPTWHCCGGLSITA